jgi:DnaJ-domain-containing protein 1
MGFDPRHWRSPPRSRPITANVEALLAENEALLFENEALRRDVRALRQFLEQVLAQRQEPSHQKETCSEPRITRGMVERWCQAMARHPGWSRLRVGPPGGLRDLIEELRRQWWNPTLELDEELNRHNPGLGTELAVALRGPHSRGRWAVRAAFALYGARATEWLTEEPLRVVAELAQRVERLDRRRGPAQERGRRRGTRTANHSQGHGGSSDGASGAGVPGSEERARGSGAPPAEESASGAPPAGERAAGPPPDPRHLAALRLLGLDNGASPQAIKRAYWRLAKAHHPDLGGNAEAFHRLDAAYRLLVG